MTARLHPWRQDAPPLDGTTIILIAGLDWHESPLHHLTPICAAAFWSAEGEWLDYYTGQTLRRTTTETLHIHAWLPYPFLIKP